ncbi:MAG: prepilin-type N-terminal cleavage/methylation domain-containing protein [Candidatus Omnitrophica bacterium]|nr:prepilin-type N-terminal cleavage/methylation domain-containing protein [Candidatus Omnitrophota bacterium]
MLRIARKKIFGSGFTLTELLIVVIIIAVLATLSLPMLLKSIEKAKVGEAISNLNLIRTGQKIYLLEKGFFAGTGQSENALTALNIENPNDSTNRYFYYEITTSAGATSDFTAKATRGGSGAQGAPGGYDYEYEISKNGAITSPDGSPLI